jgi:alkylation response protein AidB-like acyl-CoA dehydrogenase
MNLEFSEDQKFIQQTARDYLNEYASLEVCRAVLESEKPYDADLWKGVAEMGWLGATVPEELRPSPSPRRCIWPRRPC